MTNWRRRSRPGPRRCPMLNLGLCERLSWNCARKPASALAVLDLRIELAELDELDNPGRDAHRGDERLREEVGHDREEGGREDQLSGFRRFRPRCRLRSCD
jgi:hypothetical protein